MGTLIRNRRITNDVWRLLRPDAEGVVPDVPASGHVAVPLAAWFERRTALAARPGPLGVWLASHEAAEQLASDVHRFQLVAVHFPRLGDGRGYSTARLLRERLGFAGELRAFGDVGRDQLLFLERSGFDAFELREGEDALSALAAFTEFSESYQADAVTPLPLFRRRPESGARA
jgi:uncharacterized protein (DUF934 family)